MIVPDINLLLYAYNREAREHARASAWWCALLQNGERVGMPWIVIVGFVRLSTTRGVFTRPVQPHEAIERVEEWLAQPGVFILHPGSDHLTRFHAALVATPGGPLVTDAHLAALAIENDAELHSNDDDFGRFAGLRWRNPLAEVRSR